MLLLLRLRERFTRAGQGPSSQIHFLRGVECMIRMRRCLPSAFSLLRFVLDPIVVLSPSILVFSWLLLIRLAFLDRLLLLVILVLPFVIFRWLSFWWVLVETANFRCHSSVDLLTGGAPFISSTSFLKTNLGTKFVDVELRRLAST